VLIRHATPAEVADPTTFTVEDPVGWVDAAQLLEEASAGRMRPEWTWFADDGSRIVARAVWVGAGGQRPPARTRLPARAARSARTSSPRGRGPVRGHAEFSVKPEYNMVLRTGWPDDPGAAAAVAWRTDAARAAGLTDVVERLRYEWTPAAGVPAPSGRLVLRAPRGS